MRNFVSVHGMDSVKIDNEGILVYPEFGGVRIYTLVMNFEMMQRNISVSLATFLLC
jgi:hypothetical protein